MPVRWAYLKRVLAGAIFGLYMAHLLYFLNPQIDITPLRLVTVTIVYGAICGLLFGTALWLLRVARVRLIGRPEGFRTHGFGFVVFAAFISSFIYFLHLTAVQIYLPRGAVRILSKATNAITLTAFILLALWVLERNADRRTSRIIFLAGVVLIALSSVLLYQRRESYRIERKNVVVATIGAVAGHRPVILVAIRNLPYDWIVTMNGEGLLPFFEQHSEHAYFTRLEPFPTTSSKSLWASLATGKLPYRHGVTGRFSYRTPLNREDPFLLLPEGVGFRAWGLIPPVTRISAPLPAGHALPLWSLFQRLQLDARVVAWPSLKTQLRPVAIEQRFQGTGKARDAIVQALAADTAAAWAMSLVSRDDPGADDGFVLISGPGTAHRDNPPPAYAIDVVPTILFAAGLPVGRDMDGRALTEAFDDETLRGSVLSAIQTYEAERVVVRRSG